jgi:hypothetical protein
MFRRPFPKKGKHVRIELFKDEARERLPMARQLSSLSAPRAAADRMDVARMARARAASYPCRSARCRKDDAGARIRRDNLVWRGLA